MILRECMTGQPITIQASQSIQSAAKTMRECDVGALPVLLEDKLVGIVTDRDIIIRAVAASLELDIHQVQEIMTTSPVTAGPETTFEQAAITMSNAKVRRLPIVQDGKLVGIVSLGDLVVSHQGHDELCGSILENISQPIGPKCVM